MPPDRAFIEATLADVENGVRLLQTLASRSRAAFTADLTACYASAYALIICIEGVAGIASHLIAACDLPAPRGMADCFLTLHQAGIIRDADLRERLAAMAAFRNLLVHRYWRVDYDRVYTILQTDLSDFGRFAADLETFLSDRGL